MRSFIATISALLICLVFTGNADARSLCGSVVGKAVKISKPARPANLTGTVEVVVRIDENGNVMSAASLAENLKLREIALRAAIRTKFTASNMSGLAVISQAIIKYEFTADKSKAAVSAQTKFDDEYRELSDSKIGCGALQYDLAEFITQKIRKDLTGKDFELKKLELVVISKIPASETTEKVKPLGFEIISQDSYFGGIFGKISVDKVLKLIKLEFVEDVSYLSNLGVCDYQLVSFERQQRENCQSLKGTKTRFAVFYGDVTPRAKSLPKPLFPENGVSSAGKVFVQVKFDAEGNILAAKAVAGVSEFFPAAEKAALQAKLAPMSVNSDLKFAIGLLIYDMEDFKK